MFVAISAKLKTMLAGVAGIAEVQDYDKGALTKYPAATFFASENRNSFETTSENKREYIFTIRLHEPMEKGSDTSHEKADATLRKLVDDVIALFDKNYTLEGVVNFCQATPSKWGYVSRESGVVRVAEVNLTCIKLVSVV